MNQPNSTDKKSLLSDLESTPVGNSELAAKIASGVISDALRAGFDVSRAIIVFPGLSGASALVSSMPGHYGYDSEIELLKAAIVQLERLKGERHES